MIARCVAVVAVIACLSLGCSGVDGPSNLQPCEGPVTVSVSSGTAPLFSWSPQCLAGQVIVGLPSGFANFWIATGSGGSNTLRPPIRYGVPPDTAALGTPQLEVGSSYRVVVLRATGDTTAPFTSIGTADFVP